MMKKYEAYELVSGKVQEVLTEKRILFSTNRCN